MVEGGCHCGAVRIQSTGQVLNKALCYCLDCRKITGSTHSTNMLVPNDGFSVTKGTPKEFTKLADSGHMITIFFCGDCGTTIWSQSAAFGDTKVVKMGTLDSDGVLEDAKPLLELYVRTRPSWIPAITGAAQYEAGFEN